MNYSYNLQGIVVMEKNIGESNNSYYYRLKYVSDEIGKQANINSISLTNLDLLSKKKSSEKFLNCKYINVFNS